ncbi:MAG: copper chaperone PCu(A)C [Actinomycetota bacterium]
MTTNKKITALVGAAVLAVTLAACGGDSNESTDTTVAASAASEEVVVEGQWARTSPAATDMGAAYMTITSPVDDALVAAAVSMDIAMEAQIHEVVPAEMTDTTMAMDDMATDTTMAMGDMAMTMREVDEIALPAGVAVELKPGGYHVMLMGLKTPLEVGTEIKITLTFKNAGDIEVTVPVLEEAP